jgi:hypothetical protein
LDRHKTRVRPAAGLVKGQTRQAVNR